jgi:hypothetical protein
MPWLTWDYSICNVGWRGGLSGVVVVMVVVSGCRTGTGRAQTFTLPEGL